MRIGTGNAPERPDRGPVPAGHVAVHQVVVQQREVVHQLDGDRARHPDLGRRSGGPGREQGEGRAQRLAARSGLGVAVGVGPAEVVGRLRAAGRVELVDGRPQGWLDQVAGLGQAPWARRWSCRHSVRRVGAGGVCRGTDRERRLRPPRPRCGRRPPSSRATRCRSMRRRGTSPGSGTGRRPATAGCPATGRKVASRSRVTKKSTHLGVPGTRAAAGPGRAPPAARSSAAGRSTRSSAADIGDGHRLPCRHSEALGAVEDPLHLRCRRRRRTAGRAPGGRRRSGR